MDFVPSEEQQMLADSVRRWLGGNYDFETRRALAASEAGFSRENWRQLAELGVLGLNVPEEHGGMGAGAVETLLVMQAFGESLLLEPFVSTAVVAVALLERAGSAAQRQAMLPAIAAGELRFAIAALEPGARHDFARVASNARADADRFVLSGRKAVVVDGGSADTLIVSARTSGAVASQDGLTLFLVNSKLPGLNIVDYPTIDGRRAAEVTLDNVVVSSADMVGAPEAGYHLLEWAIDRGIAALCSEAVGAMERLATMTVEHLRNRRQFGQPLADFQALQHRVADMQIAIEQARAMAFLAAAKVDEQDRDERRRCLAAAKSMIGRSGRRVGKYAVQLHGGMGMTDELAVGDYFKRLTAIDLTWGDSEYHAERFGELL
jgi:alkylation response protein AidB-like acyl-CoA dehydrogenase